MNFADVIEAKVEAERFLDRLDKYEKSDKNLCHCPARAAMIRSSLDLTRALARMRMPE